MAFSSGFDYEFVDKPESKYECSICLLTLRNPTQTKCGHRFCRDCIMSCITGCNRECPIDKLPLDETSLFHDSCIEREILQLKVKCSNSSLGCKSKIDLRYIDEHLQACSYQPVMCPNECSVTVLQKELEQHLKAACLNRLTMCQFCDKTMTISHEQLHISECPFVHISCELCKKEMPRKDYTDHKNKWCSHSQSICTFAEHGCSFKASRNRMEKHLSESVEYHIQLLSAAYKKINTLVLDLYRNMTHIANGTFTRQPSLRSQLSQNSTDLQLSPQNSERTFEGTLVGYNGPTSSSPGTFMGSPAPGPSNMFYVSSSFDERQELEIGENRDSFKEMKMLQKNLLEEKCSGNDESKKPGNSSNNLDNFRRHSRHKSQGNDVDEIKSIKEQNEENKSSKTFFRSVSEKCLNIDQRLMEEMIKTENLSRRIDLLELSFRNFTYDSFGKFCSGSMIWKLTNFSDICNEMEREKKVFNSPPFYTSQHGYKFCLRSNVTISNSEAYLTLYLHLMQSENDDFLSFPFQGTIQLSILDCKDGAKNNFTENVSASGKIDAFQRPKTFRNVKGYGYKEFIPIKQIFECSADHQYLKNNTLYIKALVVSKL